MRAPRGGCPTSCEPSSTRGVVRTRTSTSLRSRLSDRRRTRYNLLFMENEMRTTTFGLALAAMLATAVAVSSAQAPQGRGGRGGAGQTVEKIRQLKPDLYMITGGGANTLVRVTTDGLIVVDTKNPGDENFNRVMEEIRSVSSQPVKYVLNTHHHPDHVGNNQKFIDAGAQVVALEALKTRMASEPATQ